MNLLNKNYNLESSEDIRHKNEGFWYFDIDKKDFFLRPAQNWFDLKSDAYTIKIWDHTIKIPTNYYLIIGDYDAGLDAITPYEVVGRQFEVFMYKTSLEADSWTFEPFKIVGYEKNYNFTLPDIKHLISVGVSDTKAIFISEKDQYNKLKNLSFSDII